MVEWKKIVFPIVLLAVIVLTSGCTAPEAEKVTIIVGTTVEIGRVPHPQYVHGGDDVMVNAMFEGLVGYKGLTLELEPVLATDLGTVSADGLEYTFSLRQGVKFHDGTDFNATSVKDHFDRMFVLGQGMTYIFIEGLLNKTEIVDNYKVKFTLNNPNSAFRDTLAHIAAFIPSATATATYGVDNLNDHPVVMEGNRDWWQIDEGVELKVDELIYTQFSDPSTMKLAIEQGDIHATDARLNVADYPSLLANTDLTTYDVSSTSSRRWFTFQMNASEWTVFSNKTMRQAFAYALPYDEIISVGLGGSGSRQYSFLPPELLGYKQVFDYDYDTAKAKALIAAAGLTEPVAVTLHITPTHYGVQEPDIAALIKQRALAAGFDVTIEQQEYGAYKSEYKGASTQEINLWAWTANYPDTDDWASNFMGSSGWGPGYSHASSGDMAAIYPYADDLIVEAAATVNDTRKLQILEELQDLWAEWVPNIFAWREVQYKFTRANVIGIVYGPGNFWDIHFHGAEIT
ncbi:MAG: ABC transporter substrate-binding protein [Candidatus Hodarchaeales archaeon]|jgi:peptide/nickel transport system substrate-binding protein